MRTPSPLSILGSYAEKLHLTAASVQWLGIYEFAEPLGGWIEGYAVIPLATFVYRYVWPRAFYALAYGFHRAGDGCIAASHLPVIINARITKARQKFGRLLSRIARYLQRKDLE